MGQDREDRQGDSPGLSASGRSPQPVAAAAPGRPPPPFEQEIRGAVRYERGLAVKAAVALAVVAAILVAHVLLLS